MGRFLITSFSRLKLVAKGLADRVKDKIPSDGKILEVACGTGISTYHLRQALPSSVHITATDLNPAMLNFAKGQTYQALHLRLPMPYLRPLMIMSLTLLYVSLALCSFQTKTRDFPIWRAH